MKKKKDYGEGNYIAYGAGPAGPEVGRVADGYLSSGVGTWIFRLDEQEVYGPNGDLVGFIEDDGIASRPNGQFLFRLEQI